MLSVRLSTTKAIQNCEEIGSRIRGDNEPTNHRVRDLPPALEVDSRLALSRRNVTQVLACTRWLSGLICLSSHSLTILL